MWDWFTKHATELNVVVTTIYTALTGAVVFLMWRSNHHMRESIQNTQKAEESRVRPYVVVKLDSARSGFVDFCVTNAGQSAAVGLTIASDPEIKPVNAIGAVTQHGRLPDIIGLFHHEITYLAPGQTLRALVGHYSGLRAFYPSLTFCIRLKYGGVGGPYDDAITISLKPTDGSLHLAEYEIGDELHKIRESIEKIERKTKS
jgi:hypothetical protein